MKQAAAVELTTDTFDAEVIATDGIVLVDFYGPGCEPCRTMAPIIDELAADDTFPKTCTVDTSRAPQIAARYGIRSVPTFLYFRNGNILKRSIGVIPKSDFYAEITEFERQNDADLAVQNLSAEFQNLLVNGDKPDALIAIREILEKRPEMACATLDSEESVRPIDIAVKRRHTECGGLLIEFGVQPGLADLIALKFYDEALDLVKREPQSIDVRNAFDVPPVWYAVMDGHAELIDALLERGADLSMQRNGNLIMWAMRNFDFATAEKLVAAGVPVQDPEQLPEIVAKICEVSQDDSVVAEAIQFANTYTDNLDDWRSDDGRNLAQILAANNCTGSAQLLP